jgi:hypothetical protein
LIVSVFDHRFGKRHLRALAALPQLVVLNLDDVRWEEESLSMELRLLVESLPHLRVSMHHVTCW